MHQAAWALALFGAGTFVSFALTLRFCGHSRLSVRWAAVCLVFVWLLTVIFHSLAAFSLFRFRVAIAATLAPAVVAHLALLPLPDFLRRLAQDLHTLGRALVSSVAPTRIAVGVCVVLMAGVVSKALLVPPLGWDAVSYHMAKAAMWVQRGSLQTLSGPGGWSYFPLFVGGGDLLYAWAVLPFRSDLLAGAAGAAVWMATGLATYALARCARVPRVGSASAAMLALFTPAVYRITGSGYVEPVLQLYTVLMAMCGMLYLTQENPRWLTLAIAAAGLMAGVKIMGVVLGAAGFFILTLALVCKHRKKPAHWLGWAGGIVLALCAVGPWWWRATMKTGRPLSPIPLRIFGVSLGVVNPDLQWIQERSHAAFSWAREWTTLNALFEWNPETPSLGPVWAAAFVLFGWALARMWRAGQKRGAVWLAGLAAAFLIAYYHPEMWVLRTFWVTSNARYWIQILPLVAVALSAGAETVRGGRRVWACAVFAVTLWHASREMFWGVSGVTLDAIPWTVAVLCVCGGTLLFFILRRWWVEMAFVSVLAVPLLLARLAEYRDRTRWEVYRDEGTRSYHGLLRYWVPAAERLDQPGISHRIAVTSAPWQNGDNWLVYPFLGRRFQNELMYVPISESGEIVPFDGTPRYLETSHTAAWVARLYRHGVTHVMSFWPPSVEGHWMLSHPQFFVPLSVSRKWGGCFRVRPWDEARVLLEQSAGPPPSAP